AHGDMIAVVLADARERIHYRDPVLAQVLGITDARQQQQMGRSNRACRYQDLTLGRHLLALAALQELNSNGASISKQKASDMRARYHLEVASVEHGLEITVGRAVAATVGRRDIDRPHALAMFTLRVLVVGIACLLGGVYECNGQRVAQPWTGNANGSVSAVMRARGDLPTFQAAEIRQ